ncbi:MAG: hypothetical protein HKN15_04475 [Xanthomonadales bacterium]|nr:hypothetical protein [Xanthomonadales bacterium]
MSSVHTLRRWRGPAFVAVYLWTISALAQTPEPVFQVPSDPEVPVISYSETPELLGNPDRTPRVQVFGDGLVWVHYPVYMKKAGDYQMQLSRDQLQDLLRELAPLIDFDKQAVSQVRHAAAQARIARSGMLFHRSDSLLEAIELNLGSYQASGSAPARAIEQELSWTDIRFDAQDFPEISELQDLDRARQSIRALLDSENLEQINTPGSEEGNR